MSDKGKDWHKFKKDKDLDIEKLDELAEEEDEEGEAGDSGSSLEHPSYTGLEERLTLAEKQAHENWEKAARALAELENVRRRAERDVTNAHRYGQEKIIQTFLPVIDSLEQAIDLSKDKDASMHEGLLLTMKLFLDALGKLDVEQIDPLGLIFDPQEHEAISMQEAQGVKANTVLTVFQKGYKLSDRVIRPARVIVAKA
jgi:molecular chaperone GrpE